MQLLRHSAGMLPWLEPSMVHAPGTRYPPQDTRPQGLNYLTEASSNSDRIYKQQMTVLTIVRSIDGC